MFSKDKKNGAPGERPKRGGIVSVIGAEMVITGDIAAADALRIDGRIEGNVRCATLDQGASGTIVGDVEAESARLAGSIEGKVSVGELVLEAGARISGDVSYDSLSIAPGARVDGRFAHRAALTSALDGIAPAPGTIPAPGGPSELFAHAAE